MHLVDVVLVEHPPILIRHRFLAMGELGRKIVRSKEIRRQQLSADWGHSPFTNDQDQPRGQIPKFMQGDDPWQSNLGIVGRAWSFVCIPTNPLSTS